MARNLVRSDIWLARTSRGTDDAQALATEAQQGDWMDPAAVPDVQVTRLHLQSNERIQSVDEARHPSISPFPSPLLSPEPPPPRPRLSSLTHGRFQSLPILLVCNSNPAQATFPTPPPLPSNACCFGCTVRGWRHHSPPSLLLTSGILHAHARYVTSHVITLPVTVKWWVTVTNRDPTRDLCANTWQTRSHAPTCTCWSPFRGRRATWSCRTSRRSWRRKGASPRDHRFCFKANRPKCPVLGPGRKDLPTGILGAPMGRREEKIFHPPSIFSPSPPLQAPPTPPPPPPPPPFRCPP